VAKKEDITAGAAAYDAFKASAVANKGKLVFVTVDASGASKDPVMNFFGIKEDDVPAVGGSAGLPGPAVMCYIRHVAVVHHVADLCCCARPAATCISNAPPSAPLSST
jgi:hypothetical protein